MYAVIESGNQQYRVSAGDTIQVQKIAGAGKEIKIDKVLMISKDDAVQVGRPYIENASVKAEVVGDMRARKVIVYKQKPRKGYRKLNGHRQSYTVLKITDIVSGG
jgi:large subunit ribosomal protein L21